MTKPRFVRASLVRTTIRFFPERMMTADKEQATRSARTRYQANYLSRWIAIEVTATLVFFVGSLFASAAIAQVRIAFPEVRSLELADFPRIMKLADGVWGYEDSCLSLLNADWPELFD